MPEGQPHITNTQEGDNTELDVTSLDSIKAFAHKELLESAESYKASLMKAIEAMEGTEGLVELREGIPTIVISDLHARREMLATILEQKTKEEEEIFELLKQNKINIVCVGDGLHSENMDLWNIDTHPKYKEKIESHQDAMWAQQNKWKELENAKASLEEISEAKSKYEKSLDALTEVEEEIQKNIMDDEITRSFGLMKMVMELKAAYPESFHYIRGNHDDVSGRFAHQSKAGIYISELFKEWIEDHEDFGKDFMATWNEFEDRMPLVTKTSRFVISHAAPKKALSVDEIKKWQTLESSKKEIFKGFTWTENTPDNCKEVELKKLEVNISEIKEELELPEEAPYIIGHRPVDDGKYRSQFNGKLIQINDPVDYVYMEIPAAGDIDPERDVVMLKK